MSQVKEGQGKRAEAERLQKKIDKQTRQAKSNTADKNTFSNMMQNQGSTSRQAKGNAARQAAQQQQGEQLSQGQTKQADQQARTARMARGGVLRHGKLMEQAKSFDGTLNKAKQDTEQAKEGRVENRQEGLESHKAATTERVSDQETKAEDRKDADKAQAKAEAKAEGRVNAAISGGGRGASSGGEGKSDGTAMKADAGKAEAAGGAKGAQAHEVKQIPEEILKALANEIYVGFNAQGMAEFRVELKDGVLDGATMKVTADDRGRIHLKFEGVEGNARNLVKASEGDLARRLEKKGLNLASLEV